MPKQIFACHCIYITYRSGTLLVTSSSAEVERQQTNVSLVIWSKTVDFKYLDWDRAYTVGGTREAVDLGL